MKYRENPTNDQTIYSSLDSSPRNTYSRCPKTKCASGQIKSHGKMYDTRKLIDPKRSAAYLTFLRREAIRTGNVSADGDYLFFTFTNNSCWPVWLDMSGVADKRHGDASLYYAIENKESGEPISGRLHCHVCSTNPISPGKSLTFSIPYEEVSRKTRLRILYEFDWERNAFDSETENTVLYYFSNLPETVLPKVSSQP